MTPTTENDLSEAIKSAKGPLRIIGGGTRTIGTQLQGEVLSTSALSGITLYEPGALTIVAQAGTPIAEIKAALDAENQRFAFEPMDHRMLLGTTGTPTVGGMVSGNVSGSRRIAVGACRDHALGVRFVDGMGTISKNGGRVMKNVTGYDLVKLLTGAYGTLGVLSQVSLKVLPKSEATTTLVLHDLDMAASVAAMSAALGSPYEVTGAAAVAGKTYLRIEGFADSVAYRITKLREVLNAPDISELDTDESAEQWRAITNVEAFANHTAVWRVSLKPSDAPEFVDCLAQTVGFDVTYDWGGGLLWIGATQDHLKHAARYHGDNDPRDDIFAGAEVMHANLQHNAALTGGHATLFKAPDGLSAAVSIFQPETETIATLSAGLRAKFDPRGILNAGLMA